MSCPHRTTPEGELENDNQRSEAFWSDFLRDIQRDAAVKDEEVTALLTRVARTGLDEAFIGYLDSDDRGHLTPRYYRLRQLIQDKHGNVISHDSPATD